MKRSMIEVLPTCRSPSKTILNLVRPPTVELDRLIKIISNSQHHSSVFDEIRSFRQTPGYILPLTISTPRPYRFPPFHSPSKILLFALRNLPWPSFLSSEYQPSKTDPSVHL